ncbi:TonB system transport protein ExbD [Campylobacter fetus]|uniref:Biopolymer transport protein ExbD n=1 Tax=Campylobacter fetus subsp. testudinum TaxID=1507806 RepID=A0AAX0HBX6_CAMFE|nr:TonB system transport protein ExbD [Campylobacter fetus]AVK81114.1 TonB system transport protein ExbD [Campylobacter fetus subsp. testudinum]MPB73257.1 TonB system transport protein ExbD [Campylobacter fetus]MPB77471.1 TonB system transport protein ExbD [Campylobacter fetus]OCR87242.1 biopolymer transporter ExbD [Campylobacter fetus subsp. testudinum]OCR91020.1 biopolymer transporter ExbD [Campylobacter fetus subsp. testudinum]
MRLAKRDGLNIVPFIDIMLVLLAIVLSISTFIAEGNIKVDLPKAQSATNSDESSRVIISIDKNSNIFIDDKPVLEDEIVSKISTISPETLIILRSDKSSKFESFIKVIDALKSQNHEKFAISAKVGNE